MKIKNAVALLTAAACLMLAGCGSLQSGNTSDTTHIYAGESESDVFSIETSFGEIKYPAKWADSVIIDKDDEPSGIIRFKYKVNETPIFDILIGRKDGKLLGFINSEGKKISVSVNMHPMYSNDKNYAEISKMQEDINVIFYYLSEDYDFELYAEGDSTEINSEVESVFYIETSVATIRYPQSRKEFADISVNEGETVIVEFSAKDSGVKVFDLILGETEDTLLGTISTESGEIPVRAEFYDLDPDSSDYLDCCGMKEDINVILEGLVSDYNFIYAE